MSRWRDLPPEGDPLILAIDTSTEQASIALSEGSVPIAEWSWRVGRNHSTQVKPAVQWLMQLANTGVHDIDTLVVASGPGSFSGLRVGISLAKGLAMARDIPLVGISTLDVLAFAASPGGGPVCACMEAGRGEVYVALYSGSPGEWQRLSEYLVLPMPAAAQLAAKAALVVGSAADAVVAAIPAGRRPDVFNGPWQPRRASFLAELGRRFFDAGGSDQRFELEPLYLRRSAAEEKHGARLQE